MDFGRRINKKKKTRKKTGWHGYLIAIWLVGKMPNANAVLTIIAIAGYEGGEEKRFFDLFYELLRGHSLFSCSIVTINLCAPTVNGLRSSNKLEENRIGRCSNYFSRVNIDLLNYS